MRFALTHTLAALTLSSSLTMVGCTISDGTPPAAAPEINTKHIYFHDNQIMRYLPESGTSVQLDSFDSGENKYLTLDTDLDKQGFEYVLYVKDNTLYLLDYDLGAGPAQRLISSPGTNICAVHARKGAPQKAFESDAMVFLSHDLFKVDVVTNAHSDCAPATSAYYEVDFTHLSPKAKQTGTIFNNILRWRQTTSAFVHGTLLHNYTPVIRKDPETQEDIRWGYIGYDIEAGRVVFYNQNGKLQWSSPIPGDGSIPRFFQAARDVLLVQSASNIYVLNVPRQIFAIDRQESATELPGNPPLTALFETPTLQTLEADGDDPISLATDGTHFAIKDGRYVHYYQNKNPIGFLNAPVYSVSNDVTDLSLSIFSSITSPRVLVHMTTNTNQQSVVAVNPAQPGSAVSLASGQKVEARIIRQQLYVTTLTNNNEWQSAVIKEPLEENISRTNYSHSKLAFLRDHRSHGAYPLILTSEMHADDGSLVNPIVAPFAPGLRDGFSTKDVLGYIEGAVYVANPAPFESFINNDIYGGLYTADADANVSLHFLNLREHVQNESQRHLKFNRIF